MAFGRKNEAASEPPRQSRTITLCASKGCQDEGVVSPLPGWPKLCDFHDEEFEQRTGTGPDSKAPTS